MDRRFQFEIPIRRCRSGYAWVDNAESDAFEGPVCVLGARPEIERAYAGETNAMEPYEPLKTESGLFRIFAALPLDRDAIRKFADKYGQIYDLQQQFRINEEGREYVGWATPLSIWRQTILAVRYWVNVWDLICEKDHGGLLKYVREFPNSLEKSDWKNTRVRTLAATSLPILNSAPKDRLRAAKKCIWLGVWESELRENVTVHLRYDENRDTFGFRLRAEDLAVAIWAQFAMAIIDNKEYVCCKTCGKPFEVSPEVARTNREYCRTACRLKAFRARKREAARLKKRGKSLKEIANQLGSDLATVRGWIKQAEEK